MSAISAEMSALLQGKSAAVACSPEKSAKILLGLKEMGASVTRLPVIEIRETEDKDALDAALSRLDLYAWILFTSSYAVRFFARRAAECGRLAELSRHRNICAVGPATAAALRERGIETLVHYPLPLPLQPALKQFVLPGQEFPIAEKAAQEILSLPLYPEL